MGGQFAGWRQHQGAHRAATSRAVGGQPLQQRQGEGSGLAGAGLGGTEQIFAVENGRNGLGLDRRRLIITLFAKSFEQGGG